MGLSPKKKILLRIFVDYKCEQCCKDENEVGTLEPHRIRAGYEGGKYEHRNIKMLCHRCHELISAAQRRSKLN